MLTMAKQLFSHEVFVIEMNISEDENTDPYYQPNEIPIQITCTKLDELLRQSYEMSEAEQNLITSCVENCGNPFTEYSMIDV